MSMQLICTHMNYQTLYYVSNKEKYNSYYHTEFVKNFLFIYYFPGIILTLNGTNYSNHSVITIDDIGKDDATALTCHTINIDDCCVGASRGRWRYPSDIPVKGNMTTMEESFRRNRGTDIIYLYHRDTVQTPPPTGIYTCEIGIKNSSVIQQHIFVGLYKVDQGTNILVNLPVSKYINP